MRPLAALGLLLLLMPSAAPLAPDDALAWLAGQLHVQAADLPATLPATEWTIRGGSATMRPVEVRTADLAARVRDVAEPRLDVAVPAVPGYLGAGVRGVAGTGVGWMGAAVGARDMPCMAVTSTADTPLYVPGVVNPGGPLRVGVQASLPDHGVTNAAAKATMDVGVLPAPSAQPVVLRGVVRGEADLFDGMAFTSCYTTFSLKVSLASFAGDGTLSGS